MKTLFSLIISAALVASGYSQTRNVLVGTNNAVVQPTNFWSADATNARSGLGLGSAATNAASAFQPASSILSNLVSGGALTFSNITIGITNVTGLQTNLDSKLSSNGSAINLTNFPTVALASNITGTAALATNVTGVVALTNGGTGATNAAGARTALGVGSTNVFVGLTNLGSGGNLGFSSSPYILGSTNSTAPNNAVLALDAAGVRSVAGLTLAALTNTDNASFRTAVGLGSAATNAASAFQPSSTVLSNLASNNGASLTNIAATNVVGVLATNGSAAGLTNFPTVALASNVTGTIAISNGGSGATTADGARTNLGLGATWLTNTAASNFRAAIGLGWSALTNSNTATSLLGFTTNGAVVYNDTNTLTFTNGFRLLDGATTIIDLATDAASDFFYGIAVGGAIEFSGTNTTANASTTRTNLGLGATWLTNTNVTNFRTAIGFGWPALTNTNSANFRSDIGLGWPALTNTNAGTSLVSVSTNGEVVSPTNFWAVAPISTTVQYQTNVTGTSTNAATNSRNLFLYSLATSVSGITNTITLPTNPATTFEGDRATVTHLAQTNNAVTAIRQLGTATNLITLNQLDETVLLMYRSGAWMLADNISYIEPIYFSGTNASANAAASRTNLGLGATWLTNTNVTNFRTAIGLGASNDVTFNAILGGSRSINMVNGEFMGSWYFDDAVSFGSPNVVRTNLGIPLPALTNTNNANFQAAVFATNTIPTNSANVNSIGFNTAVAWMEVTVSTNGTNHSFRIPLFR